MKKGQEHQPANLCQGSKLKLFQAEKSQAVDFHRFSFLCLFPSGLYPLFTKEVSVVKITS